MSWPATENKLPSLPERYRVRRLIGTGGVGAVYEAHDDVMDRVVAIKVLPLARDGQPLDAEQLQRFRQEARISGRLSHPNIVTTYELGETTESAWIVMELIGGETLQQAFAQGQRFALARTHAIMDQLLAALAHSHAQGVVHRDVKPSNILLTADGHVKVTDFGIARLENSTLTQVGTLIGTPAYMAPEQLQGQAVDRRADLWAAGVVLYQLLTGEKPFEGSVSTLVAKILSVEAVPPSLISAHTPGSLDAVIACALAKRPNTRFASAEAFAAAIRAAVEGAATSVADDPTIVQRVAPVRSQHQPQSAAAPVARRRRLLPMLLGAATLALAAAGGLFVFYHQLGRVAAGDRQDGHPAPAAAIEAASNAKTPPAKSSLPRLLAGLPPWIDRATVEENLRRYSIEPQHRAFALYGRGSGTWQVSGLDSRDQAERRALEACQLASGAPCILFATDDEMHAPAPGRSWAEVDMPRLHPKPEFDADGIPILTPAQRQQPEISSYGRVSAAKAMAIHPWGRVFTAIGTPDQRSAEQKVLYDCNADPDRRGRDGPCFLYAAGNQVVLPERRTQPRVGPYEAITAALALVSSTAANPVSPYASDPDQKALALLVENGRTFWRSGAPTEEDAEQWALEGCELQHGAPCVLVATGSTLRAPDPRNATRRPMERLRYAGPFRPDQVPMGLETQRLIEEYATQPGAKAIAVRPEGSRFWVSSGAAMQTDAERQALARCNDDGAPSPCFLYASGDRVVLPERRTQPTSAPPDMNPEPAPSVPQRPASPPLPEQLEAPSLESQAPVLRGVPEQTNALTSPLRSPPRPRPVPLRPARGDGVTRPLDTGQPDRSTAMPPPEPPAAPQPVVKQVPASLPNTVQRFLARPPGPIVFVAPPTKPSPDKRSEPPSAAAAPAAPVGGNRSEDWTVRKFTPPRLPPVSKGQ